MSDFEESLFRATSRYRVHKTNPFSIIFIQYKIFYHIYGKDGAKTEKVSRSALLTWTDLCLSVHSVAHAKLVDDIADLAGLSA